MNGMWRRWAQRRRLVGVIYLGATAVAIAAAFLMWALGAAWSAALVAIVAVALIVLADFAFYDAHRFAKLVG